MNALVSLYDDTFCAISYHPELKFVHVVWKGLYVDGEDFRKIHFAVVDALEQTKSNCIIGDAREMKMIWKEDRKWLNDEWYPMAVKAGFRHLVLLLSTDSYNELAIKEIVEKHGDAFVETSYFDSMDDAKKWIKKKSSVKTVA
jgi:hypothetical protein